MGGGAEHECATVHMLGQMMTVELVLSFHLDTGVGTELRVDGRC